jgi:hypothetical protein
MEWGFTAKIDPMYTFLVMIFSNIQPQPNRKEQCERLQTNAEYHINYISQT